MSQLIVDHLWQSTVFALLAGLLALALHRNRAHVRYWLWLSASAKFLVPFAALVAAGRQIRWRTSVPVAQSAANFVLDSMRQPFAQPEIHAVATASTRTASPIAAVTVPTLVFAIWLAGLAVMLFMWWVRWRRMAKVLRDAIPMPAGPELTLLRRLESDAGRTRPLAVVAVNGALEPGVFGTLRPVLLWPRSIGAHLDTAQLKAILAHELAHVRRRDNFAAALHMMVQSVFWFHPLVWWIGARLVEERERACDEDVLRMGSEPQAYAESILKTCELYLESPLVCVAGVTGADLKRRVKTIMSGCSSEALSRSRRVLLTVVAIGAIVLPLSAGVLSAPARGGSGRDSIGSRTDAAGSSPKFEVASIKPHASTSDDRRVQLQVLPGGRFVATNVALRMLIRNAYQLQDFQLIGGPDWLGTDRFDIVANADRPIPNPPFHAKPDDGANPLSVMLRTLLAERFALTVHHESRELPIYALVIARSERQFGPQLRTSSVDCEAVARVRAETPPSDVPAGRLLCGLRIGAGTIAASGATLTQLANALSMPLGRVIVDKTGLTGAFDYDLAWTPDQLRAGATNPGAGSDAPADPNGPSIFTAIQEQLGLKLESQRGPVDVLIIDRAGHPTEN